LRFSILETESFPQRGQRTPSGQRRSSRYSRHLSSERNCSISSGRFMTMPRRKKKARELNDEDVMKKLFPKPVREEAKKTASESRKEKS
jgi:hypothetical protein